MKMSEGDDKIRPGVNTLTTKFQDVCRLEKALTIDEVICPFRGCMYFRVYMKGKPHKYDIKIFEICDLESGYVCNLEVYTGANLADTDFNSLFNVINRLLSGKRIGATPFTINPCHLNPLALGMSNI
jgi:hypothetical protein